MDSVITLTIKFNFYIGRNDTFSSKMIRMFSSLQTHFTNNIDKNILYNINWVKKLIIDSLLFFFLVTS
jgi:hypothetical protein